LRLIEAENQTMQDQPRDSTFSIVGLNADSIPVDQPVLFETQVSHSYFDKGDFRSSPIAEKIFPDWYFILLILILAGIAWARIAYGRFLNLIWISAYSFQFASKTQNEQSVVQKRFGLAMDLLYLINGSLFLFLLNFYFAPGFLPESGIIVVLISFLLLLSLLLFRVLVMRFTAYLFKRTELFKGFLYHFFIYNKVIGMVITPFLIAIPYAEGVLKETLIFTGIALIVLNQLMRLFRAAVYVFKNVILFFYLILYLCTLEILPLLVVIKVLLSLA